MTLVEQYKQEELDPKICQDRCNILLAELVQWDLWGYGPDYDKVCEYLISMDERMAEADYGEAYTSKMEYVKASISYKIETAIEKAIKEAIGELS